MFTHPLFLIGLVSLAIPIVVHLFNFRRYKKVYFSNVDRLTELQRETRKQSQLRQYLVLVARMLAILFLVLAFAQPVIPHKDQQLMRGKTDVSIYLDNSFSMENTDAEGPLLEKGRQKVREIVAAYKPTDRFQLLTNDAGGAQFRWLSRDNLLAALDEVETSPATRNLSYILYRQYDFLHQSGGQHLRAYLVSDFQTSSSDVDQCTQDTMVEAYLVPLEAVESDNIFVDTLVLNAPAFYLGSPVTVEVRLHNSSATAVEKVPVRLFVNGQQRALATADLPAEGSVEVPLHFVVDQTGPMSGCVELTDYPVTFDDQFYFSLNVGSSVSMLTLRGKSENPHLKKLFADDTLVDYHEVAEHMVDYASLTQHQFLVLDELDHIPSGMAQTLQKFVEEGGSLLLVPNEKSDIESYNAMLSMLRAPLLKPWKNEMVKVSDINYDNELYRGVFAGQSERMELPTLSGRFPLQSSASTVRQPALMLSDGGDYLTVTPYGKGRLYLLAAPLQPRCSDFVQQALFVPTLYNMALFSRPISQPYILLGETDPIQLPQGYGNEVVAPHLYSVDSTIDVVATLRHAGGGAMLIPTDAIQVAGNYLLGSQGTRDQLQTPGLAIAFDYPPTESLMRFYSARELAQKLDDNHLNHIEVMRHTELALDEQIRQQMEGTPLWRWSLLLSLLFLFVEIVLLRLKIRTHAEN